MKLSFDSAITIICGENNAGKTSFNIFKISLNFMQNSLKNNIFVEKTLKSSKILYNDEKSTKSDISLLFPCYSLVFGFNNILLNDSSYRRDFIDTGMFHVEPESRKSFNVFEKVLKQRNFLLKSKKYDSIDLWDRQLIDANNKLSEYRESYFKCLKNHFSTIIESIKNKIPEIYNDISSLELEYINGWGSDCFDMVLKQNQSKDRSLGYTSRGTHRSDFIVTSLGKPVRESGSMSTLVLSCLIINLAKINVFHVKHGFKPVLLIDDLFFGIDDKNLRTVVKLLVHSRGNIVLTAPNIYKKILEKVCEENQELKLIAVGENS